MIEKKKLEEKEASSNHTVNNEYTVLHLCPSHHKDSIVESSAHNEWGNVPGVVGGESNGSVQSGASKYSKYQGMVICRW